MIDKLRQSMLSEAHDLRPAPQKSFAPFVERFNKELTLDKVQTYVTRTDLFKNDKTVDRLWKSWDLVTCLLTCAGFITATIDYEYYYVYNKGHIQTRYLHTTSSGFSIATASLTLASLFSIVF